MADFPWRPIGHMLVERGLIDEYDLEWALKEQRLRGMLLGELLVSRRLVTPMDLAAALALQHGVTVEASATPPPPMPATLRGVRHWRPLGRILVDAGLITESGLQRALLEQRRSAQPLGEILVRRRYISSTDLAAALAEQQGVAVDAASLSEPDSPPEPSAERQAVYELRVPGDDGAEPMFASPVFLDATDAAFELLDRDDPEALEIVKVSDGSREVVWSYTRAAA